MGSALEANHSRKQALANGQIVASKALGIPNVYVEAVDQDGNKVVEKVESEIALLWPFVHKEVVIGKHGKDELDPVRLPKQVGQDILALLLEYCRYHRYPGRSDKERKIFDEKFIRLDTRRLCELTSAADSLDMRPLVDLSSRALARMIEGKSPDEIRETFHLPDDLTEEEKLEPVKNVADDPRIRLLNRLYAKKRKELAEKKAELQRREAGVNSSAHPNKETRSVEELLSFIEEQGQSKKPGKKKKPKKKKEQSAEEPALETVRSTDSKQSEQGPISPLPSPKSLQREEQATQDGVAWPDVDNLDDADLDDEIEAFERSLRADWEDRRTELILMAGAFPSRASKASSASGHGQPKVQTASEPANVRQNNFNGASPALGSDSSSSLWNGHQQQNASPSTMASPRLTTASEAADDSRMLNGHADSAQNPLRTSSATLDDSPDPAASLSAQQGQQASPASSSETSAGPSRSSADSPSPKDRVSPKQQCRRNSKRSSDSGPQALSAPKAHPADSRAPHVMQNHVADRSSSDDAVLANAACDAADVASCRGNGAAPGKAQETSAETVSHGSRALVEGPQVHEGGVQIQANKLSSAASADTAPSTAGPANGREVQSEAETLVALLHDFLQQLGHERTIGVELKAKGPCESRSEVKRSVLIERVLPGLGKLKLQCSDRPDMASDFE